MSAVELGALCWNQYTDWPRPARGRPARRSARLRHALDVGPPVPDRGQLDGPIFEAWLTLAAWAQATERVRIGLMVGANTFREPALTAKMATTLDHISNGRAILGIGARVVRGGARGVRVRVRERLPGAAALAGRGAADHARDAPRRAARPRPARATRRRPSATTRHRSRNACRCSSAVAARRSRSSWSPATATPTTSAAGWRTCRRKEAILLQHCETVGRDPAEIERTTEHRDRRSSATRAPRPTGSMRRCSSATGRRALEGPAGRHAGGRRRAARSRSSRSATATSSPGSRRRTTRSR